MQNRKRILSVTIRRRIDEFPDTSWLGEYSNKRTSEYSIDRAHSEDCDSVNPDIQIAKQTLEHVQQTIGDFHNAILGQYNGTLANEKLDAEKDALDTAYDEIGELIESIDECDCNERGDMRRNELRYFNPSFNYVDKYGHALPGCTPEEIRTYCRQDYERMERLNAGDWCYIGIIAEASVSIPSGHSAVESEIESSVWGVESDGGREYLESMEKDELANVKSQLKELGFSARAISTAFKPENIERKEAY